MNEDDSRHGKYAGFMAHLTAGTAVCADCKRARLRYNKALRLDHNRGKRRTMPITGTRRRLQALCAIGYTHTELAMHLNVSKQRVYQWTSAERYQRVYPATALEIGSLFERLCMTPTVGVQAKRIKMQAATKGWLPPLAWDDIDNDPEPSTIELNDDEIDEVTIIRILDGDVSVATTTTPSERAETARRWAASGRSLNELSRLTGWKIDRYFKAAA